MILSAGNNEGWLFYEENCSHVINSDGVVLLENIGYGVIVPLLCVIGIILNILNIIVLFHKPLNESLIHTYLGIIAIIDIITLALVAPIGFARCSLCKSSLGGVIYEKFIYMPLGNISGSTSVWMTTVVTMERYVAVRSSLPSKSESVKRAWLLLGVFGCAAFLLNMPYFFCYVIRDGEAVPTPFGAGRSFEVFSWVRFTLIGYVPGILIIVFNALLLHSVWIANKRRTMMLKNSLDYHKIKNQIRLSVLLVTVSIIFFACHMPEGFSHPGIIRTIKGPCGNLMDSTKIQRLIGNTMEILSYSYHFVLYISCNDMFRRCFLQVWPCSTCHRNRVGVVNPANSRSPSLS